jgi:hypothetical protein
MKYLYFWLRFVRHASQGMLTTGKWRNFGGAGAESRTVGGAIRCAKPCTLTRVVGWTIAAVCGAKKEIPGNSGAHSRPATR